MATTAARKGAEAEINRLRAQVRTLQAQLARDEADQDVDRDTDRDDDANYSRRDVRVGKYRRAADEATDTAADLPVRVMDEVSKLARGLTFAYLEQLRAAGEILTTFADDVMSTNRPEGGRRSETRSSRSSSSREETGSERSDEEEQGSGGSRRRRRTITGVTSDLPADISSGFLRALNRSLDIPGKAVERFQSAYRETEEEAEPTLARERRMRDEDLDDRDSERGDDQRSGSSAAGRHHSPISAEREEVREQEAT